MLDTQSFTMNNGEQARTLGGLPVPSLAVPHTALTQRDLELCRTKGISNELSAQLKAQSGDSLTVQQTHHNVPSLSHTNPL